MPVKSCSDEVFLEMFTTLGPSATAKKLNLECRDVYRRRDRLEARLHSPIKAPKSIHHPTTSRDDLERHPERKYVEIKDGIVMVGSDSHYWPDEITTAHRAFCHFAKKLQPKIIIKNGDELDGATISRHAPIGWENRPSLVSELEAVKERHSEIMASCKNARKIWPLGNHDCLDSETECLTRRGWVTHDNLRDDDQALSLAGDEARWTPIAEIVRFPFDGELYCVDKTRLSMAVTGNHRVLLDRLNWRSKQYDLREYRHADDLPHSFNVPMAGHIKSCGSVLSDEQIALTGWLLTDGCYDPYNISIYQSKLAGISEITRLLKFIGLDYSVYTRQRGIRAICGRALLSEPLLAHQFFVKAESSRRVRQWVPEKGKLPEWAHDLDGRQFQILLDALVAGDGTWDGYNPSKKTCCVIYGTEQILSSIQSVSVLHGWRSRLAIDNRGDYRLCMTLEPKLRVEKCEITKRKYTGTVWCLRVPTENFMVRRRGSAYFTGNSRFETRLAAVAPEYGKIHGVHLKDHFPEWEPCYSVWINDDLVIKHRYKGGVHATHNNTVNSGRSMVTGHLHSLKVTPYTDYNGTRFGVDCGTMADPWGPQFRDYMEDNPRNWRSGFVVLTFHGGKLLWPEVVSVQDEQKGLVEFRGAVVKV